MMEHSSDTNNNITFGMAEPPVFDQNFETSKETDKIDDAFAKAQANFLVAIHDKKGARDNKYATIASMLTACRKALGDEKIHLMQFALTENEKFVRVLTRLSHAGQYYQAVASMPVTQPTNPQSHGSSYTYLRRYALMAMLGLVDAETDDDGAGGPKTEPEKLEKKADWESTTKVVKNHAPGAAQKISPMQQVSAAISKHSRDRELVGQWIRAAHPNVQFPQMTQALADKVIQKIIDTPDEGFEMELKEIRSGAGRTR